MPHAPADLHTSCAPGRSTGPPGDDVVLLDERGRPCGTAPKALVHGPATPLHLAFSCHVVDAEGRVLLAQRALDKRTWPGAWSNACCGHPRIGETLRGAIARRVHEELGARVVAMDLALPDFTYRAVMGDGTVEHELCPVVVAVVDGTLDPDPAEVHATAWTDWEVVVERARHEPGSLSPWSILQIEALAALAPSPVEWLARRDRPEATALDRVVALVPDGPGPAPATPAPALDDASGQEVVAAVKEHIRSFVDDRRPQLADPDRRIAEVVDAVADLVRSGGKRLRPELVHWGWVAGGGGHDWPHDQVVAAGAAIELLHTFALIHDDVMDRSERRRGRPTAEVTFAGLADGLPGARDTSDAGWFGISAALLAGDLASTWADEVFGSVGVPAARQQFDTLRNEVVAGQYLDVRLALDGIPTEAEVRQVALLKSARYSVTRPLLVGAALAGAPDDVRTALARFGDSAGLAFQMRDDVLGLFGDPAASGKGHLDDLREGKRTLLVVRALRLADDAQRRVILDALGDPTLDEGRARVVRDVVAATGALASVEALITSLSDAAEASARGLPEPAASALRTMVDRLVRREG